MKRCLHIKLLICAICKTFFHCGGMLKSMLFPPFTHGNFTNVILGNGVLHGFLRVHISMILGAFS
jgi:hypothetical protein